MWDVVDFFFFHPPSVELRDVEMRSAVLPSQLSTDVGRFGK